MSQIKLMCPDDYHRVMEFMQIVHPDAVSVVEKVIFGAPFRRPEHFAYIESNGRIISFTGLLHHTVRLGDSQVRAGEIAVVGTHPDFRRRGYASELIEYWIDYMRCESMVLGMLYGIPDFYQQFGFEYAVPHHAYNYTTIAPEQLGDLKPVYSVESMQLADLPRVNEIYAACCRHNAGTEVRSLEYWQYRVKTTSFGPHRWMVVKDGVEIKGYLWLTESDRELIVRESGAADEAACQTIAAYMHQVSRKRPHVQVIGVRGPQNSPLARYLYQKGARFACTNEIFKGTWAGMFRIVDLAGALDALCSAMTRRLADTCFFTHSGQYHIESELGSAGLIIENGQVKVSRKPNAQAQRVRIPAGALTQMIMGYKSLQDFGEGVIDCDDRTSQLFSMLFPVGHPCVWDLEMSEELL